MISHVTINKKILFLLFNTVLAFTLIALRLMYLQIYCGEYFELRSQKNFIRYTSVLSARGNIRDIHGNLLATNRPMTTIYWQGTGKNSFSDEQLQLLQAIENM